MKIVIAIGLLAATVVAGNIGKVDWTKLRPLVKSPERPLVAQLDNDPQGRITGGQTADRKQFPYQVYMDLYGTDGNYSCGGSLLSKLWVVTAAHCAETATHGVLVYLGAWNRFNTSEVGQQRIQVGSENVFVHDSWNRNTAENDIALMKFHLAIEFNEFAQPIPLPEMSSTYEGQQGTISGWGKTSDLGGTAEKLQYVEVPIMRNSDCSPWYRDIITENHICIDTTGGTSTCNGDSGGPLTVLEDGSPILIALTSFGSARGCEYGFPSVFTRISSYIDWMDNIMENN